MTSTTERDHLSFHLSDEFVQEYESREVRWGFPVGAGNSLGELTFITKYSRLKSDGTKERWHETCRRVVEGVYSILKDHCVAQRTPWNHAKAARAAEDMYERMFTFRWLPPGRGLEHMGTPFVWQEGSAPLQNCAMVSTQSLGVRNPTTPFVRLMEMSMLGIGVGFDVMGAGNLEVHKPDGEPEVFTVPDSREGWCDSLDLLLRSYFLPNQRPLEIDVSQIRPRGTPLKRLGGVAGGPEVLERMHDTIHALFGRIEGQKITSRTITDIMNLIAKCVVAGNRRRSATLALGMDDDKDFISLKDWTLPENEERMAPHTGWGSNSNNSIIASVGTDYGQLAESIVVNGEPGLYYRDLARSHGRLGDPKNDRDFRVMGCNPCAEQSLEDNELCTLVETFPTNCDDFEDFRRTLKVAYLYAKAVTLLPTHWPESNEVMTRNRRIGCSVTGIAMFVERYGWHDLREWLDRGYEEVTSRDRQYSEWLGVRESIKTTSVKPSGCRPWEALTATADGILTLEEMFVNHPEGKEWAETSGVALQGRGALATSRADLAASPITRTYDNGKAEVLAVKMNYGMEVRSTANHRWWVTRREQRGTTPRWVEVEDWVKTDELKPGDVLGIEPGIYIGNRPAPLLRLDSRAISMRGDATEILQPDEMSPDLAWLLGYLWGDGAMSPSRYRIRFTDERLDNLDKACEIVHRLFGIDVRPEPCHDGRKAHQVTVASKMLWHWLIKNGVWKYYADRLDVIPEVVRRSTDQEILAFLAGLIDADGCVSARESDNVVILSTADEDFARHVQDVALSVGVSFGRSYNTQGVSHQDRKSMWLMTTTSESVRDQFEAMESHCVKMRPENMTHPQLRWSHQRHYHHAPRVFGKVLGVESVGEMPTFDIEVADTHWYYAGAIKSHNTVSLLAGVTPGVHWPVSARDYLRRVRFSVSDPIVDVLREHGYDVEPSASDSVADVVATFPVTGPEIRSQREVTVWEKVALAACLQEHWADNMVSATFSFSPEEEGQIASVLNCFDGQLKTMSFLPMGEELSPGAYPQMPYEAISDDEFEQVRSQAKPIDLRSLYDSGVDAEGDKYCSNDTCVL